MTHQSALTALGGGLGKRMFPVGLASPTVTGQLIGMPQRMGRVKYVVNAEESNIDFRELAVKWWWYFPATSAAQEASNAASHYHCLPMETLCSPSRPD